VIDYAKKRIVLLICLFVYSILFALVVCVCARAFNATC
jgi:uncharacterized membrane protein YagU involved in acid resistance